MRRIALLLSILMSIALVAGCREQQAKTAQQKKNRSIFVLCGAGLRKPINDAKAAFTKETGIKVRVTYAGAACLLAQIDNQREGDIYIPGEEFYLNQAIKKGLVRTYEKAAYVIPVIAVAKGNPKNIKNLNDLTRKDVRVGIGDPHATAVGKQANVVLKNANLMQQVKDNDLVTAATAPDLVNDIRLGHLDAVIVWDAVALWSPEEVDIIPIEAKYNAVSTVPIATLKFSADLDAANQFQKFCCSDKGKAIFKKNGYSLTPNSQFLKGRAVGSRS
jgi:molybdate transport system substrate-binding protein